MKIEDYYKNDAVRRRILEFLGGRSLEEATCIHLSRCDELMDSRLAFKSTRELDFFLDNGLDVGRSLWDREFLIAHLDKEAMPVCEIPIRLTDVVAKRNEYGREIIAIHITEYGDPLNTRMMRVPFSVYLKPWEKEGFLEDTMKEKIPYIIEAADRGSGKTRVSFRWSLMETAL